MPKGPTSFTSDNQPPNRPGRGKSERNKILEAMERAGKTEEGFYDLLIKKAMDNDDSFTLKELMTRLSPIPKSVSPLVNFEFPKDASPHKQAVCVLSAVSEGIIPSDIGNMFIQSIKSLIDIEEYTDLKDRIDAIERGLGVNG